MVTNPGKNEFISVDGQRYLRLPIKTHLITPADDMAEVAEKYVKPLAQKNDLLFVSEKALCAS